MDPRRFAMKANKPTILASDKNIPAGAAIIDAFENSLKELFFIRNPQYRKGMSEVEKPLAGFIADFKGKEIWIHYPWRNIAVKCIPEEPYFELRTARNRNIITKEEQENYRRISAGIAGLSVGSGVLDALVVSGGPKALKIADFDVVEASNLNRIKAKLTDVGENKIEVAARGVWELDPFADLCLYDSGVNAGNLEEFIIGSPKLNIFIDEMDSIDIKIAARLICKKAGIPVLMATDNGDAVILDVERFDLEPERQLFHGLIGDIKPEEARKLPLKEWIKLAGRMIGPEYLPKRMQESVLEIGKTIAGVPQLGATAMMAGSAISFAVRRISNEQEMPSGRYVISLEEKLIPKYTDELVVKQREAENKKFTKIFLG